MQKSAAAFPTRQTGSFCGLLMSRMSVVHSQFHQKKKKKIWMFHTILSHCQMLVKKKKTTTKKLYPRPISTPNCGARRDTMLPSILVFCQDGATSSIVTKSSPEEIQSIIVFGPTKNKSNFTQRTAELCAPNCSAFAPVIEVLALCSKEEHFHGLEKSCFLLFFFFSVGDRGSQNNNPLVGMVESL